MPRVPDLTITVIAPRTNAARQQQSHGMESHEKHALETGHEAGVLEQLETELSEV